MPCAPVAHFSSAKGLLQRGKPTLRQPTRPSAKPCPGATQVKANHTQTTNLDEALPRAPLRIARAPTRACSHRTHTTSFQHQGELPPGHSAAFRAPRMVFVAGACAPSRAQQALGKATVLQALVSGVAISPDRRPFCIG